VPQLNVRVSPELKSALEERAYRERLSLQELVSRMLVQAMGHALPGSLSESVDELRGLVEDLSRRLARLESLAEGRY
jgi:hypothetical protein